MARDVEYNVTASDRSGEALRAAEENFRRSQDRIDKINKEHGERRVRDLDESAARIGRGLENTFGVVAPKLSQSLASSFAAAGEASGPLLVAGVAAAAPLMGALVSAGIIGGAGVGGVVGGALLAAKDPRVAGAGKTLGENLLSSLRQDAAPFVEPLLQAIGQVDAAFQRMQPRIQAVFANSSRFVAPLTDGVIRAADGILHGFERLTARAGPVIDQLSDSVGDLGEATGDMLATISGGAGPAADALGDVTDNLSLMLRVTGVVVRGLTEVYGGLEKLKITTQLLGPIGQVYDMVTGGNDKAKKATDEHARSMQLLADAYQHDQEGIDRTNQYLADSQAKMDAAARAADQLTDANRSLYDTETSLARAIDDASRARKENGRTLDVNTEKGRANRDALSGVARAAKSEYDAFVQVNGVGPKSAALADNLRGKFIALAQKLGASSSEARQLADKILGIPNRSVTINANAKPARDGARSAQNAIDGVHGKSVSVDVIVNDARLRSVENRLNRLGGSMYADAVAWAAVDRGSGAVARTGGPAEVNVSNRVEVSLDGAPFYQASVRAAEDVQRRQRWRDRQGVR